MINSDLNIKGSLEIHKYEGNKIIEKHYYENLVTDIGLDYFKKLIGGDITGGINKLAIGSGINIASKTDTSLNNKLLLIDIQKDYSIKDRINFMAKIPENTFTKIVNYTEAGLVYRTASSELLITRLLFDNVVYQKPENSLSFLYSLEIRV